MKTIINKLFIYSLLLLTFFLSAACSDWNEPKPVDLNINSAKKQNPELWARYMQVLHTYKQSKHYLAYAHFNNSPEKPVNEGSYLRSLPDSLDIVTLGNSSKISDYDREDIQLLQEKSIRVLYFVDYAAHAATFTDVMALGTWLDKAITVATELELDGFAFTGIPFYSGTDTELAAHKEKSRLIVSKLSAAVGQNKLLILEGNPAFVADTDLDKLNYIVLNTADLTNVTDLKLQVAGILANGLLPKDKLLLAARTGGQIINEASMKQNAVILMTDRVVSLGPLGGLSIYDIGKDYYSPIMNYELTRSAIQLMNPSK
ncbi:glycoside hydrolase family 18 [Bacteroides cellulosilyticus]|uniref:glycoside hydrolase family 18 n=1 Tax=Bacteroides cellulosilyticus TaxID=246787 RepID=UPI00356788CD